MSDTSVLQQYIVLRTGYWEVVKTIFIIRNIPIPTHPLEPDLVLEILLDDENMDHVVPSEISVSN